MVGDARAGGAGDVPEFCPWCGRPSPYHPEEWRPRWQTVAEEAGSRPPEVIEEVLQTDAFVTGCDGCLRMSHVIGHEAKPA